LSRINRSAVYIEELKQTEHEINKQVLEPLLHCFREEERSLQLASAQTKLATDLQSLTLQHAAPAFKPVDRLFMALIDQLIESFRDGITSSGGGELFSAHFARCGRIHYTISLLVNKHCAIAEQCTRAYDHAGFDSHHKAAQTFHEKNQMLADLLDRARVIHFGETIESSGLTQVQAA